MNKALKYVVIALEKMGAENVEVKYTHEGQDFIDKLTFDFSGDRHTISHENYYGESWIVGDSKEL